MGTTRKLGELQVRRNRQRVAERDVEDNTRQQEIGYTISSVSPTVADNFSAGYTVFHHWLNTTTENVYVLVNASAGTWKIIT